MKKQTMALCVLLNVLSLPLFAQTITSNNKSVEEAYNLAIKTVKDNTRKGILAAGGEYGGEWVRDISINTWNGVSFFSPEVSKNSLWSVTVNNKEKAGHQYWDRIIWVHGAYNYYLVTHDKTFLSEAFTCGMNTIKELEATAYDATYGLFMGPSVFNDGIAGYDEPIYNPAKSRDGYVLGHNADKIKCLSTNCAYYMAYSDLNQMFGLLNGGKTNADLLDKAAKLKAAIRKNLYEPEKDRLNYLIDQNGKVHVYQEALGVSYAIRGGVVTPEEGLRITQKCEKAKFGIPSITPSFPRFTEEKPGRHNRIIWPFVNASYADAALSVGNKEDFNFEFFNLISLALDADKGNKDFWEVYNATTGKVDGGWQSNGPFKSCSNQTWSATGYLSMVYFGLVGMQMSAEKMSFKPYLPKGIESLELKDLKYAGMTLNIKLSGQGSVVKSFKVNGKSKSKTKYEVGSELTGVKNIEVVLK